MLKAWLRIYRKIMNIKLMQEKECHNLNGLTKKEKKMIKQGCGSQNLKSTRHGENYARVLVNSKQMEYYYIAP